MKVEKINNNKVKITLTFEELEKRDINLKEIEKNSEIAKNLFVDLIEESNIDSDFEFDNSQLLIEASSDNNNLFIVTITKVDNLPDIKQYSNLEKKVKKAKKSSIKNNIYYKVDSSIYIFDTFDNILDLCKIAKSENLFFGKNTLYKYDNCYFLIFAKSSIKNKKFLKTFVFLSEFCKNYYSYNMLNVALKEKSELIIANSALQNLSKL